MDLTEYFLVLRYVLMLATFIVLILVFLHVIYGKEEKQE
jgi:hypothetical protein